MEMDDMKGKGIVRDHEMIRKAVDEEEEEEEEDEEEEKMMRGSLKIATKYKMRNPAKQRKACLECTKKCLRIHGSAQFLPPPPPPPPLHGCASAAAPPRSFFKIMLGDFTKALFIPPKFSRTLGHLVEEIINIQDPYGLRWRVKLSMINGSLAFVDGWQNFVLDHMIKAGELVVFTAASRRTIYAHIFSISACERQHYCESNQRQSRKKKKRKLLCDNERFNETLYHSYSLKKKLYMSEEESAGKDKIIQIASPGSGSTKCCNFKSHAEALEPNDKSLQIYSGFEGLASPVSYNDASCHIVGEEIRCLPATEDTFVSTLPIVQSLDTVAATKQTSFENIHNTGLSETMYENLTENVVSCEALIEYRPTDEQKDQELPAQGIAEDAELKKVATFVPPICLDNSRTSQAEPCSQAVILCNNDAILEGHQAALALDYSGAGTESQMYRSSAIITYLNNEERSPTVECSGPDAALCDPVYEVGKQKLDSLELPVFSELKCYKTNAKKTTVNSLSMPHASDSNSSENDTSASLQKITCNFNKDLQPSCGVSRDAPILLSNYGNNRSLCAGPTTMPTTNASLDGLVATINGPTINSFKSENEYLITSREDTQSQKKIGKENTDSLEDKENTAEIMASKLPRDPDSLEGIHDLSEVKEEVTCSEFGFAEVKMESSSPVSLHLPYYGSFSLSLRISTSSWLELPCKLPYRLTKRSCGRRVVMLQDSFMQLWPVLYHKSSKFIGFTAGWEDFTKDNNLKKGDRCDFELCEAPEATLKVILYKQ